MSNEQIEGWLFKEAFKYLSFLVGADIQDARQVIILTRAVHYADLSNYSPNPKNIMEKTKNELFLSRASHYYHIKKLNPFEDYETIGKIKNHEYYEELYFRYKLSSIQPHLTH